MVKRAKEGKYAGDMIGKNGFYLAVFMCRPGVSLWCAEGCLLNKMSAIYRSTYQIGYAGNYALLVVRFGGEI
jgi:hypothetical protein